MSTDSRRSHASSSRNPINQIRGHLKAAKSENDRDRDRHQDRDRDRSSRDRSESRSTSNRPKGRVDLEALGFGNTKHVSEADLKLWNDTKEQFEQIIHGLKMHWEDIKEDYDEFTEYNSQKLILDFLIFLERGHRQKDKINIKTIKDTDPRDIKRIQDKYLDRSGGQQTKIFKIFIEKANYYAKHPYVEKVDTGEYEADTPAETVWERVELFLDQIYGQFVAKRVRKMKPEYFALYEAVYFSVHIRRCKYLNMEVHKVANDFIKFLDTNDLNPGELKKHRMSKISPNDLPVSCQSLHAALAKTIHEFYIHQDASMRFCALVDSKEVKKDPNNAWHGLLEYVFKCVLEEFFLMWNNNEIEQIDFKDLNLESVMTELSKLSDHLMNSGLTLYGAVYHFFEGTLNTYLNSMDANEIFEKDITAKLISIWISNLVKRRQVHGPPLNKKMRAALQRKVYVLIKSGLVVEKEVKEKAQFNVQFPHVANEEIALIKNRSKPKDKENQIKEESEIDEEMLTFMNIDENKDWTPILNQDMAGQEAFIDMPGNVMITQPLKIPAKMRVNVNATLCGVPRIRPLAHMKIHANKDIEEKQCRLIVQDHRLVCGNQLLLSIVNIQDNEEVELHALSLIAYAQVLHPDSTHDVMASYPQPTFSLNFLKHYYKSTGMTNINETDDGGFQFGHGHDIKIRKRAKVNFKITYSEVLKTGGSLYTVESLVFFLQNFTGDYKEYLKSCLSARMPLVAHRDHFNLWAYMQERIPKCYQILSKNKILDMDVQEGTSEVYEGAKLDTILEKFQHLPQDDLIQAIREMYNIPRELAVTRLTYFLMMTNTMKYPIDQMVWDVQKCGKLRELFEESVLQEFAKFYRENPDLFNEADHLFNRDCLSTVPTLNTYEKCKQVWAFFDLIKEEMGHSAREFLRDLDRILAKNQKNPNKKIEDDDHKESITDHFENAKNVILLSDEHSKLEEISIYACADKFVMAFIALRPIKDTPNVGKIVKMGSRLLASCEKHDLLPAKISRAYVYAIKECGAMISMNTRINFFDFNNIENYNANPRHAQYVTALEPYRDQITYIPINCLSHGEADADGKQVWMTPNKNPAGALLYFRPRKPFVQYEDKIERLYGLKDTLKAVLSVTFSKKKKAKWLEKMQKFAENNPEKMDVVEESRERVITKKSQSDILTFVKSAWTDSKNLAPFVPLIQYLMNCLMVTGTEASEAKFQAMKICNL